MVFIRQTHTVNLLNDFANLPALQVISRDSAALPGYGAAADDTISWTRGEMLGRGAYGTVSVLI